MIISRWISDISWWWQRRHSPLASLPEWNAAKQAEKRAKAIGCTREIGRARKNMNRAVHAALRGVRG